MSIPWPRIPFAAGLTVGVLLSCVVAPDLDECQRACDTARRCGLLPSALGGNASRSQQHNEDDCLARCEASNGESTQVLGLLEVLGNPELDAEATLCRPDGLDACEELIEELDLDPSTSQLAVTATLTVRMTSALSHATNVSLESWCCYDYDYDIYESPEDVFGDGVNEIEAVYDMFEPTYQCLNQTLLAAMAAEGEILAVDEARATACMMDPDNCEMPLQGDEPAPDEAQAHCMMIPPLWPNPGPMAAGTTCEYAVKSSIIQSLGIKDLAVSCNVQDVRELVGGVSRLIRDFELEAGGLLIDEDGLVRPAIPDPDNPDLESIQTLVQREIRDEIDRPMGFLENACEELYEEQGLDACDSIVRGEKLPPEDCSGGPACSPADCLAEAADCNPALCDANVSPPSRDCGFFGITEVRLGYRTDNGAEIFGEPIVGCASRPQIIQVFEDVRVGRITPVAVVSGNLGASLTPEGDTVGDGSYSWYIEGETRWVSAGESRLDLASPLLEHFKYLYENPLEFLGWVPQRFPIGQACDNQPALCESIVNDNCDDGIDNDGDGVGDSASPWCDELLGELVDRCVVSEPGRPIPPNCVYDPGDPFGDMPGPGELPMPGGGDDLPDDTGTSGLPSDGLPSDGLPSEGLPSDGLPTDGPPMSGSSTGLTSVGSTGITT